MSGSPPTPQDAPSTPRPGWSSHGAYRILGRDEEEVLAWLRRAHADIGDDGFTALGYRRWRQEQLLRGDQPIPNLMQLVDRYGCFGEAARLAIPDLASRRNRIAGSARAEKRAARAGREDASSAHAAAEDHAGPEDARDQHGVGTLPAPLLAMLDELSPLAIRELERLLRLRISTVPGAATQRRLAQLWFLAEMLARTPGPIGIARVLRKDYEAARPANAATADRLQQAYGSWLAVCRAAEGLLLDGRKRHGVGFLGPKGIQPERRYEQQDVLRAVRTCAEEIGRQPSSKDYVDWAIARRARLRAYGRRERLPGYRTVMRLFRAEADAAGTACWTAVRRAAFGHGSS